MNREKSGGDDLVTAVVKANSYFPTPRASDGGKGCPNQKLGGKPSLAAIAAMFPTPAATNYKMGYGNTEAGKRRRQRSKGMPLRDHIAVGTCLNPDWEEVLMGYPPGWSQCAPPGETALGKKGYRARSGRECPIESKDAKL